MTLDSAISCPIVGGEPLSAAMLVAASVTWRLGESTIGQIMIELDSAWNRGQRRPVCLRNGKV